MIGDKCSRVGCDGIVTEPNDDGYCRACWVKAWNEGAHDFDAVKDQNAREANEAHAQQQKKARVSA